MRIACLTWKTLLCLNCCFTSFSSLKPYINAAPPTKINTMHQVFIILDCQGQTIKAYHIQVQSSRARRGKNTIMRAFIFFIFQILDLIFVRWFRLLIFDCMTVSTKLNGNQESVILCDFTKSASLLSPVNEWLHRLSMQYVLTYLNF